MMTLRQAPPLFFWARALLLLGAGLGEAHAEPPSEFSGPNPPAAVGSPGSSATPESPQANVVAADRLFKQGVQRMDAADFEGACPMLEQSHALDPSSGTLLNLGDCYEHLGRTASAFRVFVEASAVATAQGRADRAQVADLRRERLVPRLRQLKVSPPTRPTPGLTLALDQTALPTALWSTPIAVDPGVHTVRANAPGFLEYAVNVPAPGDGMSVVVQLPELVSARPVPAQAPPSESSRTTSLGAREIAAIACGAVGVAGVISGAVFGLHSLSKHRQSDDYCSGNTCRDSRGVELMNSARTAGNVSTVSFVVGGAGLGAGAMLWLTRPAAAQATARLAVGVSSDSFQVSGVW